jgi:hypothetical protein
MTGDNYGEPSAQSLSKGATASAAKDAVADARREAAIAMARLAEAAVRYAGCRIAEGIAAGIGSGTRS